MRKKWEVNRRHFLRGMGFSLGLPLLNAMIPSIARSQTVTKPKIFFGLWGNGMPITRTGNNGGVTLPHYLLDAYLKGAPRDFKDVSKKNTAPSAHLKQYMNVFGATNTEFRSQDTSGHHRSWLGALTAAVVRDHKGYLSRGGGPGYDLMNETFDQIVARKYNLKTFSMNMEAAAKHVHSNFGFTNRKIMENLSWYQESPGVIKPRETHFTPRDLFKQLVTAGASPSNPTQNKQRAEALTKKKDVLSAVLDDIKSLNNKLGREDKVRMDEYYDSINTLDKQTAEFLKRELAGNNGGPSCTVPQESKALDYSTYYHNKFNVGANYVEKYKMCMDLIIKSMQCDLHQVFTFACSMTGTNMVIPDVVSSAHGADTSWHGVSHWNSAGGGGELRGELPKLRQDTQLKNWADYALLQVELYKGFLEKMANTQQANGKNLLDDTLAILTTDFAYGHSSWNVPLFVAGTAGGRIKKHNGQMFATKSSLEKPGGRTIGRSQESYNNVLYTFLNKFGIDGSSFGDSNTKKLIAGY